MGGSRALAQGWPLVAGQIAASAPVAPVLGALSISPNTGTIGQAYSGTISGATANSTIMLDSLTVTGTGTTRTVSGTPSGSPGSWPAIETLAGATGSPKTTSGILTVSAAGQTVTISGTPQVGQTLTASESSNWSVGGDPLALTVILDDKGNPALAAVGSSSTAVPNLSWSTAPYRIFGSVPLTLGQELRNLRLEFVNSQSKPGGLVRLTIDGKVGIEFQGPTGHAWEAVRGSGYWKEGAYGDGAVERAIQVRNGRYAY